MIKTRLFTKTLSVFLATVLLACAAQAQPRLAQASHQDDAQRLEAAVLVENLLDFGARTGSARAFLMAAELQLRYPSPGEPPLESVRSLLERGRSLAPHDQAALMWAMQLSQSAGLDRPTKKGAR